MPKPSPHSQALASRFGFPQYEVDNDRLYGGLVMALAVRGYTRIDTVNNTHHKAIKPVVVAFKLAEQKIRFPSRMFSYVRHEGEYFDHALETLIARGVAHVVEPGQVDILPGPATEAFQQLFTPLQQSVLIEIAKRYRPTANHPQP